MPQLAQQGLLSCTLIRAASHPMINNWSFTVNSGKDINDHIPNTTEKVMDSCQNSGINHHSIQVWFEGQLRILAININDNRLHEGEFPKFCLWKMKNSYLIFKKKSSSPRFSNFRMYCSSIFFSKTLRIEAECLGIRPFLLPLMMPPWHILPSCHSLSLPHVIIASKRFPVSLH